QIWVYTALPELGANYGNLLPNNPSPPILAYKVHIFYLLQTRVINFVHKDIGEMFPKWEFDVEDTPAENIIKLMFVKKPWKWTMDCWEVTGTWVVKEDSPRPQKKARKEASEEAAAVASEEAAAEASEEVHTTVGGLTKEDIKTMFKDIVDAMREGFGTCFKEIKYLSERVEAVEKKVGITTNRKGTLAQNTTHPPKPTLEPGSESVNGTNARRKSLPEDKGPDVPADASSSKGKAPEPSLILWTKINPLYLEKRDVALALCRAKMIIPNKKLYPGYNPFAPIDKKKLKELAGWLKLENLSVIIIEHLSIINHVQVELGDDLPISRLHIDAWINVLRKRFNYKDFKDSESDQNGLGRRLPDIDDVYAPVNYNDTHWIAMWISIPKRHIVVWNNICSSISPEELDVVMEPFLYMVSYLLVECTSSDEQRAQYSLELFTYERPTNIPPVRAGDCGVYTLNKKYFAKANGKTMRDKMAVDIFQELPDAHEFENKDNDANLGAYEG
ncbi:unnamed protein product, partial [Brassica oleracea]